jgi:hypothetical protein
MDDYVIPVPYCHCLHTHASYTDVTNGTPSVVLIGNAATLGIHPYENSTPLCQLAFRSLPAVLVLLGTFDALLAHQIRSFQLSTMRDIMPDMVGW